MSERIGGTWKRASSNCARLCVLVADIFQTAQAMNPSIEWPPQRVGRHLATWTQVTTTAGIFGDLYHQAILEEAVQENRMEIPHHNSRVLVAYSRTALPAF